MFVRVPAYREFLDAQASKFMKVVSQGLARDRNEFYRVLKAVEAETGESIADPEGLRSFAAGNDYSVTQQSVGYNLLLAFRSCIQISEILEKEYRHDIYYAPTGSHFITCDNPIITIEPDTDGKAWVGMGFGRPKTEVLFPLNKRACLILSRRGTGQQVVASSKKNEQINTMMMHAAQKYVYAPVGYRRLSRLFNQRHAHIKYGDNAFMPHASRAQSRPRENVRT
jgi:Protein of unknown function (DUF4238)